VVLGKLSQLEEVDQREIVADAAKIVNYAFDVSKIETQLKLNAVSLEHRARTRTRCGFVHG
jgi:hypothetical protein